MNVRAFLKGAVQPRDKGDLPLNFLQGFERRGEPERVEAFGNACINVHR